MPHTAPGLWGTSPSLPAPRHFPEDSAAGQRGKDLHRCGNFEPRGAGEDDFMEGQQSPSPALQGAAKLCGFHLETEIFQDIY